MICLQRRVVYTEMRSSECSGRATSKICTCVAKKTEVSDFWCKQSGHAVNRANKQTPASSVTSWVQLICSGDGRALKSNTTGCPGIRLPVNVHFLEKPKAYRLCLPIQDFHGRYNRMPCGCLHTWETVFTWKMRVWCERDGNILERSCYFLLTLTPGASLCIKKVLSLMRDNSVGVRMFQPLSDQPTDAKMLDPSSKLPTTVWLALNKKNDSKQID